MLYLEFLVCMSCQFISPKLPALLGQGEISRANKRVKEVAWLFDFTREILELLGYFFFCVCVGGGVGGGGRDE